MITAIKNQILEIIKTALEDNKITFKISSDNFEDDNKTTISTICEINVFYTGSDWLSLNDVDNKTPISYNRTYNYSVYIRLKNLRDENKVQDLNDLIINNLGSKNIFDRYLTLNSDEFESIENGIWTYRQDWSYIVYGLSPSVDPGTPYDFNSIELYVSPSYSTPLEFDSSIASKVE